MANKCVVGLQWGDEGKGKIVDALVGECDIVARYQGGSNAGHTVVVGDEEYILHLIPSGILHKDKYCVIGNGVVVDPAQLLAEVRELQQRGIDVEGRLLVSDRAHMVLPYHKRLDVLGESSLGKSKLGTTGRGIGPCYADKMARRGVRMSACRYPERLRTRLAELVEEKNRILVSLHGAEPLEAEAVCDEYVEYARAIEPFLADTTVYLNQAIGEGNSILFEGAQGTLLDVDLGTYPYVTSSNGTVGGIAAGTGIPPSAVGDVIGVLKAYTTRVGRGPFPTELPSGLQEQIRARGKEFGATTGRPRRCGWLDAVAVRYATMINGVDEIALTKLDVLGDLATLRICTAYRYNGALVSTFPADLAEVPECETVYEELPGWKGDISRAKRYRDLPDATRRYVEAVEQVAGARIRWVSTGRRRDQILEKD